MKKLLACILAFAMLFALAACGTTGKTETTGDDGASTTSIILGYVNDLTGDGAGWGIPGMRGAQMAIDEINAKGGVLGRQVKLLIEDGMGDPQDSVTAFNKLIDAGCVAVVGTTTSGPNIAMAPIADEAGIPLIGLGCSNELVTVDETGNLHPYSFRVTCIDSYMGTALARYLIAKNHKTCGILLNQSDAYSVGVGGAFAAEYKALGGDVIISENAYSTDSDFRAQLTNIKAASPDVLVLPWAYTYVALIAQQAAELGLDIQMAGTDGWDVYNLGEMAKGALEGAFYCTKQLFISKESLAFKDKYLSIYTEETECGGEALLGWDAVQWVCKAIEESGSADPATIRDYLENTKNYEGMIGEFSVNEHHNLELALCICTIENEGRVVTDFIEVS